MCFTQKSINSVALWELGEQERDRERGKKNGSMASVGYFVKLSAILVHSLVFAQTKSDNVKGDHSCINLFTKHSDIVDH